MPYTVYVLYSAKLDTYYIGYTGGDINERIKKHQSKHKGFTGGYADWVLCYKEEYDNLQAATTRERQIKAKKSRKYIEAIFDQLG